LCASRWAGEFTRLIEGDRAIWKRGDEYEQVFRVLKIDNPSSCFAESEAMIRSLKAADQQLLRELIDQDLLQNGTDNISKLARSLPALVGITPRGLEEDAFATSPQLVLAMYDLICKNEIRKA